MDLSLKQCLCLSLAERSRFSEGEIQTFMSVDADRTINLCNSLHDAWRYFPSQSHIFVYEGLKLLYVCTCTPLSILCMIWCLSSLPLQIGVALYLLYTQVNYAFLSGLAITIILIPGMLTFCFLVLY